ncbi:hypothetical protein ACH5RR_005520 [Cinchona calisaya]|uniref:Matrin-type domain-containing protein n=1 Tax=Cinchona calisaya TaxID=153742 RepID=A0ABD3ALF7_9GENT
MRNHLGSYECKLCLTQHNNEGNYLAHTQGKRHQTNLARRAARKAKDSPAQPQLSLTSAKLLLKDPLKLEAWISGDEAMRSRDKTKIEYPEIEDKTKPRHRFMSSFEQKIQAFNKDVSFS